MLNETHPNERPEPRRRSVGMAEVVFMLGFVSAVAGLALFSITVALVAAGALAMAAAWRSA